MNTTTQLVNVADLINRFAAVNASALPDAEKQAVAECLGLKRFNQKAGLPVLQASAALVDSIASSTAAGRLSVAAVLEARRLGVKPNAFAGLLKPALIATGLAEKSVRNRLSDVRAILKTTADSLPDEAFSECAGLRPAVELARATLNPAPEKATGKAPETLTVETSLDKAVPVKDGASKGTDDPVKSWDDIPHSDPLSGALLLLGKVKPKSKKHQAMLAAALDALQVLADEME